MGYLSIVVIALHLTAPWTCLTFLFDTCLYYYSNELMYISLMADFFSDCRCEAGFSQSWQSHPSISVSFSKIFNLQSENSVSKLVN
jgi:hypothetical protein